MSADAQHFGFFVEDLFSEAASGHSSTDGHSARSNAPWIRVPPSDVSYLAIVPGKGPQVLPEPPTSRGPVSVLETIPYQRQTYLMMLPSAEVRLNGLPVPPAAILRVGDELRVGGQWLLHVSRLTRPHIGPPPKEALGKQCSYCRIKFTPDTVAYVCPHCGTAVHCESQECHSNQELGPLECARLMRDCIHCWEPIVLEARYEYVPER